MNKIASANIAVIGAGMAGLTAAHYLIKGGAKVTIFEKSKGIGGRAATTIKDGFYLNQGPHALYKNGACYKMLESLNAVPAGSAPIFTNPIALYQNQIYDLPLSLTLLFKSRLLSVLEKLELASLLGKVAKIDISALQGISFASWLSNNLKHKKVRDVFAALVRLSTYSNNFDIMSAGAAINQLVIALGGVIYLDHGWNSIVQSMYETIKDSCTMQLNARVETIGSDDASLIITTGGARAIFDAVVLAVPPAQMLQLLPDKWRPSGLNNLVASRVACLDVCLKKLPDDKNTFALGIDEPLYFSVHSASAKLAEPGQAVIQLAKYLSVDEKADDKTEERLLALLDQLQPGWKAELVSKRFLPDMVASFGTPAVAGRDGLAFKGPGLPGVGNIVVCGDWVGAGHMLVDASVNSAKEAAQELLKAFAGQVSDAALA